MKEDREMDVEMENIVELFFSLKGSRAFRIITNGSVSGSLKKRGEREVNMLVIQLLLSVAFGGRSRQTKLHALIMHEKLSRGLI
jgi:hypothetical protein